jgi:hypothetical protein
MTQSDMEPQQSDESGRSWGRWCFVIDTAGRIVHTAEVPTAAELPRIGVDFDSPDGCPPPREEAATVMRPSFEALWWSVSVEAADRHEAGRIALALVEDDRGASGMDTDGFEDPAPTLPGDRGETLLGDLDEEFGRLYDAIEARGAEAARCAAECCQRPREFSRTSITITGVTDEGGELVRRSEEFARVRTIRGYLDHSERVALQTEDVRLLVEQAEFWQGQFAETYNRLNATVADLREELALYHEAEAEAQPLADEGPKECLPVGCPEFTETVIEFQEATWEVTFDLNGTYVGTAYGDYLRGGELDAGAEPVIVVPGLSAYPGWFTVAVRATTSTGAVETAREALREREGITGDAMAVMDGEKTLDESGATARQLGWVLKWAEGQLASTEAHAAQFRTYIERLEQAGAVK